MVSNLNLLMMRNLDKMINKYFLYHFFCSAENNVDEYQKVLEREDLMDRFHPKLIDSDAESTDHEEFEPINK